MQADSVNAFWSNALFFIEIKAPQYLTLFRYVGVYRQGQKSCRSGRQEDLEAAYRQLNDISILRLFETFLESAPLLTLHLYIVLSDLNNFNLLIGRLALSLAVTSWLSEKSSKK